MADRYALDWEYDLVAIIKREFAAQAELIASLQASLKEADERVVELLAEVKRLREALRVHANSDSILRREVEFVTPKQVEILEKLAEQDLGDDHSELSLQAITWWYRKGHRMTAAEAQQLIDNWDELTDKFYALEDDFEYFD